MGREELQLLTFAEAAELWRVSKRTVERRVAAGEIPTVTIGGQRRIREADARKIAVSGTSRYGGAPSTKGHSR